MDRRPTYAYRLDEALFHADKTLFSIRNAGNAGWEQALFDAWADDADSGPVEFLLRIRDRTGWTIRKADASGVRFAGDPLALVFRWDDLLGFTAEIPDPANADAARRFLSAFTT